MARHRAAAVAAGEIHWPYTAARPEDWERHLQALGLTDLNVTPDPVLIASEGALWGAIRHQGLLPDTVIVSDDAGQFRVGVHALCWVHAERLVHNYIGGQQFG